MKLHIYNSWRYRSFNILSPCIWYSKSDYDTGVGIEVFGFGIGLVW